MGFLPFTEPVFTRCVMLVSTTLQNTIQQNGGGGGNYNDNDNDDEDEFDDLLDDEFIVVPLDLLSGIVQGLGNTVEPFVKQSTLLPLLAVCAHYVRLFSFAGTVDHTLLTNFCLLGFSI